MWQTGYSTMMFGKIYICNCELNGATCCYKWAENVLDAAISEYSFQWIKIWFYGILFLAWEIQCDVYMMYTLIEGKKL
jgi:hypothetical protein